ncbi:DUF6850 family outer membrane beta-barrel protein [Pseudoflavitalea rhizosphaerae]|uniref:DUF6850 family outer membrane beta-barrel protein n=1 Tax=Pseudoflavitalea rhizosphaerae TaxID=1884793 RepID=UPI000F8C5A12|nr:DUF6850 family outer membrane beta-barrel protein [Pseudoflavitalea rhizosphaerae]
MLKRIIYLLPLFCSTAVIAQDTLSTVNGKLQVAPLRNPWLSSQNAAGLSVLPVPSIGRTYIGGAIGDGDLKRPQQPTTARDFHFVSERYQSLQNASFYGKFSFHQKWDDDIRWSDVMDPYRRNPYVVADSMGGDWKKQLYDLELKASTPVTDSRKLFLGAGIRYKVGTGARQNDPRPLAYTNDITLNPSLIWAASNSLKLGLTGNFNFYKEKLSFATSNYDDIHYRYRLAGLGYYYRDQTVSETRYYSGKTFGGSVQLQWEKENFRLLFDAGYSNRKEDAEDGTVQPRTYGDFTEQQYHGTLNATLLTGSFSHQWEASWKTFDGDGRDNHYGDAIGKEPPPLVNSEILSTTFYNEGAFHYRWIKDRFQDDFKWIVQASVIYSGMDNRYHNPRSRNTVDANEYRLSFTRNLVFADNKNFIWSANIALRDCFNHYIDFVPSGLQSNIVVDGLLNPDQEWLSSDMFKAGLSAEYRFPLKRGSETSLFVKAEGNIWKRINASQLGNASRNFACLTIGMTY